MPHYKFDKDQGIWIIRVVKEKPQRVKLNEVDYSSGEMKKTSNASEKPFRLGVTKPLTEYYEMAKVHLVDTVISYQEMYGDNHIDYSKLVPQEH